MIKRTCYRLLILNFVSLHRWVCIDTWLIWCVSLGFVVCGLIEALQLEVFYFQMTSKFLVFPLDIDTLGLVESKGTEIELSISLIMQHLKKKKIATCWWHIVLQVTGLNWSLYLIMTIHSSWIPTLYSEFVLNVKRAFNILNLLMKKVHNLWCFDPTLYTFRFEICYICIPFMKSLHCT